jgi:hypothetical protein
MSQTCPHDPTVLLGEPIGMYHCPVCLVMVVAGFPHPDDEDSAEECGMTVDEYLQMLRRLNDEPQCTN